MTRERLLHDLRDLGLRAGDLVMVHASLRRIGLASMSGGAELLLDVLDDAVGAGGTLMMVLGTDYPMDWVNLKPAAERGALLAGSSPFDYVHAPAMPEVGALAELFRRRPGTIVSDNPSGRFGARGARAADLLRDVPWHDYYGPGSPLDRLCAWGGRILRLGANPDTVTALHFAEYLADLPDKRRTRWDYILAGRGHVWVEALDDSQGIADWDGEDYFAMILKAYLAQGRARIGTVGAARSELIDAADIVRFGAKWMEANLSRGG
jgi:aminoglycoside N3'-acetyltransferase